jgi:3-dehydroquinate synthase
MNIVNVDLQERSYKIHIGADLNDLGTAVKECKLNKKIMVITNPTVNSLYGDRVKASLSKADFDVFEVEVPDGEEYKTQEEANILYEECLKFKLERQSAIIALGGGVIGDLAGFVAATFMRGVPFIQVPTTLLAQVDSSVGGKVAVNLPGGKNMIGVFYQPKLVYIAPEVLNTLPKEEFNSGMAEVIKCGAIADEIFFRFLEENIEKIKVLDSETIEKIITVSCQIKASIVQQDEREKNLRAILNYGHTIGHALETLTGYKVYRHGEAIAIGMVCAAKISAMMKIGDEKIVERLESIFKKAGLPTEVDKKLDQDKIIDLLRADKKVKNSKVRFVLLEAIGKVVIRNDVSEEIIRKALKE